MERVVWWGEGMVTGREGWWVGWWEGGRGGGRGRNRPFGGREESMNMLDSG